MTEAGQEVQYGFERSQLGWALFSASPAGDPVQTLDYVRTRAAAAYATRELAAGRAHIEHHRPVGCRVRPDSAG